MQRTTLYLGRSIDNGAHHPTGFVSTDDLDTFLRETVAPIFPGFTVSHVLGYWEGKQERTAVLSVVHDGTRGRALQLIARAYCEEFRQSSVLSETTLVRAGLETLCGRVSI